MLTYILKKATFLGLATAAVLIGGSASAQDKTLPLKLKRGEAISADVVNELLERLALVVEGFSASGDVAGVWNCTTFSSKDSCSVPGFTLTSGGVLRSKTQEVTFSCSGDSCQWVASEFFPGNCVVVADALRTQTFQIQGQMLVSGLSGMHMVRKLSPNKFSWQINSSFPEKEFVECVRKTVPPLPPSDLSATGASGVATLSWTDNSDDETGFVVSRRASSGDWSDIVLVGSNVRTYQDAPPTAGSYSYRVRAVKSAAESIGSNVADLVL